MTENASKTLSYFDIHFDSRCFLEDESKLEHSNGRNFVVKMDSHTIDFFSRCISFLSKIDKTRRRKVRSQVGQRTRVRPRMYMVGYEWRDSVAILREIPSDTRNPRPKTLPGTRLCR